MVQLAKDRNGKVLQAGELETVLKNLSDTMEKELARGFTTSKVGDLRNSGCAITMVVVTPTRCIRGAWIGDCMCFVGRASDAAVASPHGTDQTRCLTPPHTVCQAGASSEAGKSSAAHLSRALGHKCHKSLTRQADEFVETDLDLAGHDFL